MAEAEQTLTMSARKRALVDELSKAHVTATRAGEVGRETLGVLDRQTESLRSTEDTLESNEYVLNSSAFVLRGMTWVGWFAQKVGACRMEEPVPEYNKDKLITGKKVDKFKEDNDEGELFKTVGRDSADDEESKQLDLIARRVEDLRVISETMNDELGAQKETLDRIDNKTSRVHDKTLAVTLRAAQFTARSRRAREKFIGRFQFVCVNSARFLGAVGEDLVLLPQADRAAFFDVFEKEEGLMGFLNVKTKKWLGTTFYGALKVSGLRFGRQEECHFPDLVPSTAPRPVSSVCRSNSNGLLILSKNWGRGGWLKLDTQGHNHDPVLIDSITTGVSDKDAQLVFRPAFVDVKSNPAFDES